MLENNNFNRTRNLFLQQAYLDAWENYQKSLTKAGFINWDFVILTASNDIQAEAFRFQINKRINRGLLPSKTVFTVLSDPDGKRVGSGGATFNVLKYINSCCGSSMFENKRVLVIHSGGDSKRIPQYSSIGKLFSPVPHELPNGMPSTLFDEIIISMSGVPCRFKEGMLVLSGDIQLLFNPLQIDTQLSSAAALSVKESVSIGKNHGVFLSDNGENVKKFLHKLSEEELKSEGAVDESDAVDLDTGAILIDKKLLDALFSLISTDGVTDEDKFNKFVSEKAGISFYGDFLYPLASDSTLSDYLKEKPEGDYTPELLSCRTEIWNAISSFSLKIIRLSPAKFIHFGTTRELLSLFSDKNNDYQFLDWKRKIRSFEEIPRDCSLYNSLIEGNTEIGKSSYIENSHLVNCEIGEYSIVSNIRINSITIPNKTVIYSQKLNDGRFAVFIYGLNDNPKEKISYTTLFSVCKSLGINTEQDLWNAKLYAVCDSLSQAASFSLRMYSGGLSREEFDSFEKVSLCDGNRNADISFCLDWQEALRVKILSETFIGKLLSGANCDDALELLNDNYNTEAVIDTLLSVAEESEYSVAMRIYNAVSRYLRSGKVIYKNLSYDDVEEKCFNCVSDMVISETIEKVSDVSHRKIATDSVEVFLPLRVTWGGCWSDTPPYCFENGGTVFNTAISINGKLPVHIRVKRLKDFHVEFESQDIGVHGIFTDSDEIRDCRNPYDPFTLHKAALISVGVISRSDNGESLTDTLKRIGGGIYLSTEVIGVPKGSGLGTSSILAAACIKGLYRFFGTEKSDDDIYSVVLGTEQLMSTGGGWQDQVGGLNGGFKLITTAPGRPQKINVENVEIPKPVMRELSERFVLVYTGQRRLARNLLRDVVLRYISANEEVVSALSEIQTVTKNMAHHLSSGNFDEFAELMNIHWSLSKRINPNTTNECIDQILLSCEDLIDSRYIAGAGGGGFLLIILKKGVSKKALRLRLKTEFRGSNVDVWESDFV